MATDKITVTSDDIRAGLGTSGFSLTLLQRQELAKYLTKKLNPPTWRVEEVVDENGAKTPVVRYKDNLVTLTVYTGIARPDLDRRSRVAELVAEVLNNRELEV